MDGLKDRFPILFTVVLFVVILTRVFWLQIVWGERYERLSRQNCVRQILIKAPRGYIYDCRKTILADTRAGYTLYLPKATNFPFSEESLDIVFQELDEGVFARDIPFKLVCEIEEKGIDVEGAEIIAEPIRRYLHADTLCHIIGYVGQISREELKRMEGYKATEVIGKSGIEKKYERFIHGENGINYIEVDVKGKEVGIFAPGKRPIPGNDIYLSIDIELQRVCVKAISDYKSGAIIVINPQDGRVLAYQSHPGFDPNLFSTRIDEKVWTELSNNPFLPLFDRAKNGKYPPASVFKLAVAAAGIENFMVDEQSKMPIPCEEGMQIGRRFFGCWKEHGRLDLFSAIVQSCDVYFYQLGMETGLNGICETAKIFELDRKTNIDLPGESKGLMPDEEWFNSHYGKNRWTRGNVANLSIGQGEVLLTPLRMAVFTSTIANGGILYPPTIVDSIVSYNGKKVFVPAHTGRRVKIDKETMDFIRKAMLGVVQNEKGTGRAAFIPGVKVAGKTGTAQNPHGKDHAWFVCFAPYENPSLALVVFAENAGKGGSVAAPIARRILEYVFKPPDVGTVSTVQQPGTVGTVSTVHQPGNNHKYERIRN